MKRRMALTDRVLTLLAWLEATVAKTWAAGSATDELWRRSQEEEEESVQVIFLFFTHKQITQTSYNLVTWDVDVY